MIRLFSFDADTLKVNALEPVKAKAGSGPRHVDFVTKGGKTFMYLITELGNTIVGYEVTYTDGIHLQEIFDIGAHGEGKPVPDNAAASEIVVSVRPSPSMERVFFISCVLIPFSARPKVPRRLVSPRKRLQGPRL